MTVPHERTDLLLAIDTGLPQTLTLELGPEGGSSLTVTLPDPQLERFGPGYRYSFVPTDADAGVWHYRWWGTDVYGLEFAWPQDKRFERFEIL